MSTANNFEIKLYHVLCIGFKILFSLFTFILSINTLHIALIWNLFLALIPFLFLYYEYKTENIYLKVIFIIVWIIFLPNTFYTLTDLIHIQFLEFHKVLNPYETRMIQSIIPWIELINITIISLLGFYIGCINVNLFIKRFHSNYITVIMISFLSILCAIAIYIGRFLRFNSWDLWNPIHVLRIFIEHLNLFSFLFIVLFTLIIFIACLWYYIHDKLSS